MQQYYYRVFLWRNGGKVQELTNRAIVPIFYEDRLNEELDSGQVVLKSMPISTRTAFPPKTKFRVERYLTKNFSDTPKTWDMICEHDDVEEHVGTPTICTHRIHLIEASSVAQGMHVDNIALTFELQDVNMGYKTIVQEHGTVGDLNALLVQNEDSQPPIHSIPPMTVGQVYFRNSYRYVWSNFAALNGLQVKYYGGKAQQLSFTIPTLMCQGCPNGYFQDLFEVNTRTIVTRIHKQGNTVLGTTEVLNRICGANSFSSATPGTWVRAGKPFFGGTPAYYVHSAYAQRINDFSSQSTGLLISLSELTKFQDNYNPEGNGVYVIADARNDFGSKSVSITTSILSEAQMENGEHYEYKIETVMMDGTPVIYYERMATVEDRKTSFVNYSNSETVLTGNRSQILVSVTLDFLDTSTINQGGPFLTRGRKYNCYDLLRRALLSIDTQLINNTSNVNDGNKGLDQIDTYPIIVNEQWKTKLMSVSMNETIFEVKNLWEVLLQIGYYLHAIPFLEFAKDGTDRFELIFRQLGANKTKDDKSTKLTVFNSNNLAEYFAQYDAYVTNLYSPQNMVEEWVTTKTSGNNFLVSNDTAEIQTTFPILEIIDFRISIGNGTPVSALNYIFEESIYEVLTSDNPEKIFPAKGNSIYYTLGSNRIQGLNYVAPAVSSGTFYMSLQNICATIFGVGRDLKYNDLKFLIKYRTQDNNRLTQFRPNLQQFMKNSSYEKYPHHEQYFNPQDKIVDSERLTANLYGRLIRVGNDVYQRQEVAKPTFEKESGDLVTINGEQYYVTAVENEMYNTIIKQKVTYSKNFNQLSNIVTIPSEPRFYEVGERSKIRREVRIMDFLCLSTTQKINTGNPRFLNNTTWRDFIKRLIFNLQTVAYPNYAFTRFLADYKRDHRKTNGITIPVNQLFPSSEVDRGDPNNLIPLSPSDHSDCIMAVQRFPMHDGLMFTWDMTDNFKAGDFKDTGLQGGTGVNGAYMAQQPLRYVDVFGRADLFTFKLFNKTDWTFAQTQALPKATIIPTDAQSQVLVPSPYAIGLDKDCREELSFNYQINLLHEASEEDDDFITFPNLFGQKDSPLKMCFLSEPQTMFNERVDMSEAYVVADNVGYSLADTTQNSIRVDIPTPSGVDLSKVKSIVLYQQDAAMGKYAYIVKNVAKLPNSQKLQSWYIYPVFNT